LYFGRLDGIFGAENDGIRGITVGSTITLFTALILVVCLTQFAADVYAPSLTDIAKIFETPIHQVQWSMSIYVLGVGISMLVYGPLSEGLGRKKPLIMGLTIMLIGSIICSRADDIETLLWGRLVQGLGSGSCAALWRPIFRDRFAGEELAKYTAYLTILIMFIIPAAPLLGGYLQSYFGWAANFVFMSAYTVVALCAIIFWYKESHSSYHISKLNRKNIVHNYGRLLKSRTFIGVTGATFLSYGAFFTWFVIGPVLLIEHLAMKPEVFGWVTFLGGGAGYGLAAWVNNKFVKQIGIGNMLRFGWGSMFASGVVMLLGKYLVGLNTWAIVIPVVMFYFGSTLVWPNAFARAFTPFGDIAGYAGALYAFIQVCGAAIISALVVLLPSQDQEPFAMVMIIAPLFAWIFYEKVGEDKEEASLPVEEKQVQQQLHS
jgi:DHA1 family bicyclomycin/chloramphenicol resistance-like MFS transporter/DHA1 family 2-module integral membrane pump EmrD-like MFS transporter